MADPSKWLTLDNDGDELVVDCDEEDRVHLTMVPEFMDLNRSQVIRLRAYLGRWLNQGADRG